jgi:ferrochelatase
MKFIGSKIIEKDLNGKVGVLICNLGTPESPKYWDVGRFLKEFLSDGRVIEIPKVIWWPILEFIIVPFRSRKSSKLYKSIWTKKGSPLMVYSQKLVNKLKKTSRGKQEYVLAMRYGKPAIDKSLLQLKNKGCDKLIVIPTFPQYSGTTSASVFDVVSDNLKKWRWVPGVKFINGYHNNKVYITALADTLKNPIKKHKPQKIVFTYHGIPSKNIERGDPYYLFCKETTKLVVKKLKLKPNQHITTFQSRFGPAEWLKPYTSDKMEELPKKGITNILIIAPGFSADCLETIEEIDEENKEIFMNAGGKYYNYIPCLNDSDKHVKVFKDIVKINS